MSANNRISNLVSSQLPFFVKNDHQTFVTFMKKYYQFLEQNEGLLDVKENLLKFKDIDYVTRNSSLAAGSVSLAGSPNYFTNGSPYSTSPRGMTAIVYYMYLITIGTPVSSLTDSDLNLYNFMSTSLSSTGSSPNFAYTYADVLFTGVTLATVQAWNRYFNDPSLNTEFVNYRISVAITDLLKLENDKLLHGDTTYFDSSLFVILPQYGISWPAVPAPSALEVELQNKFYKQFLNAFPEDMQIDKALLLKHAKEFYLAKGTERSIEFLMRIMFGEEDVEFYYPKNDVIKASDGKWYIQKTLRVTDLKIDGTSNVNINGLQSFVGRTLTGLTSTATATGDRIDRFYEKGAQIDEITLADIRGTFVGGETITCTFNNQGESTTHTATANIYSGILQAITITNAGSNYTVGDHPTVVSNTGTGGDIVISSIDAGSITSITITDGAAGFQANDYLLFSVNPGASGSGANGQLTLVLADNSVHPNSYNIAFTTISLEANTPINNAKYSNLVSSITDPANNWVQNSLSFFVYANTGPAKLIQINNAGSNYSELPSISIQSNTRIRELGILGRMTIYDGGTNYAVGDKITFVNVSGGLGSGANANVTAVNATGSITAVKFSPNTGHTVGGSGYSKDFLPYCTITSASGVGANIRATAILGEGGSFLTSNSDIGGITSMTILSRGSGYETGNTFIDLTTLGDGTAQASISVVEGVYSYPGRYLTDDGMPSSYNFLQDRDYYQNYSYVIRVPQSIDKYRKTIKDLAHPSGMKLYGQYITISEDTQIATTNTRNALDPSKGLIKTSSYGKTGNTINITYNAHGVSVGSNVYIDFPISRVDKSLSINYDTSVQSNANVGSFGVAGIILFTSVSNTAFTNTYDLNLYNFLNTGSTSNIGPASHNYSYMDISERGAIGVTSGDVLAYLNWFSRNGSHSSNATISALANTFMDQMVDIQIASKNTYFNPILFKNQLAPNVISGIYRVTKVGTANTFEVVESRSGVSNVTITRPGLGYSTNGGYLIFSTENGGQANARYTTNSIGSITSITITDYGKYYTTRPTANAVGSNTVLATFDVFLDHYASSSTGNANVTISIA